MSNGRVPARRWSAILLPLLLAAPLLAQDFTTEITGGFGYLSGKVDEDGVPSDRFGYREDSTGRELSVAATRWFGGVPDDGTTPLALLPFVARRSSLSAGVELSSLSRDSSGLSGSTVTPTQSRLAADANTFGGVLDGAYFLRPGLAVHANGTADSSRETQGYTSTQLPSGLTGTYSLKSDRHAGSLGLLARPTPEVALELAGFGSTATEKGTDVRQGVGGGSYVYDLRKDASTLGVSLSGQVLLAKRRLALEALASYAATHGDSVILQTAPHGRGEWHAIARSAAGAATWFPHRTLGVTLGIGYTSTGETQGTDPEMGLADLREVVWRGGVRFFPRPGASVALSFSRTQTETVNTAPAPAGTGGPSESFSPRLCATDDRVTLVAALRF
jgi:hypothetical protein